MKEYYTKQYNDFVKYILNQTVISFIMFHYKHYLNHFNNVNTNNNLHIYKKAGGKRNITIPVANIKINDPYLCK